MVWKNAPGRPAIILAACLCLSMSLGGCAGSGEKYELRETAIRQMEAGDYAGAIDTLGQALEKSDGFVGEFELDVLKYRAEAEYETGNYAAAAHTYDVLRQVDGEKPEYLEMLGMMYALDGQTDAAVSEYKRLMETSPESTAVESILFLAGEQLNREGRADEAAGLLRDAVNDGHASGAIYNQLALSEIEAGQYDTALDHIGKGLALQDGAREGLLFNQAVAYEKKLDFSGALQSLTAYVREFGATAEVEKEIAFLKTRTD